VLRERVARRGERLVVELLQTVRDSRTWLSAAGVTTYNAFQKRHHSAAEVPHSFSFKLRCHLTSNEVAMADRAGVANVAGVAGVAGGPGDPHDVFVLVKTFMSDSELQQAPLLLLPAARARLVVQEPTIILERAPLTVAQRQSLLALAQTLEKPSYRLPRAAVYLRNLASERVSERPPDLAWLTRQSHAPVNPLLRTDNPQFHHLPEAPWQLKVRRRRLPT